MNRRFHKPFFVILVIRPPQEDCDIHSLEEDAPETASEENFSEERPLLEKDSVTSESHRENPSPEPKPASGSPVVNNNPLNFIDPLGFFLLPPIGTTPPFPKDGSYDFKVPNFVPLIGGLDVSISGSASLGLFGVNSSGESSIIAGGALGLSYDFRIGKEAPNLGSINFGVHRHLSFTVDFSIKNNLPQVVGGGFSVGPGWGPAVTGIVPSELIEHISSSDDLSRDLARRFGGETIRSAGNQFSTTSISAQEIKKEIATEDDIFNIDAFLQNNFLKQDEKEHPKKRGVF